VLSLYFLKKSPRPVFISSSGKLLKNSPRFRYFWNTPGNFKILDCGGNEEIKPLMVMD